MAKQTSVFKFTGRLGNLAGYQRNGEHMVRTLPAKVRQTSATRQAARDFGIISHQAKLVRHAIVPHLEIPYDGSLVNRLNRALVVAGKDSQPASVSMQTVTGKTHTFDPAPGRTSLTNGHHLQVLNGFRFNPYTCIADILGAPPVYTSNGVLELSAEVLRPMGSATHLQVCAMAVRINFAERRTVNMEETSTIIDLEQPFTDVRLPVTAPGKGMLFIVLQIRACISCNGSIYPLGDRRYMAADIVTVEGPTTQKPAKNRNGRNHRPVVKYGNQGTHRNFQCSSYARTGKLSYIPDPPFTADLFMVSATARPHVTKRE